MLTAGLERPTSALNSFAFKEKGAELKRSNGTISGPLPLVYHGRVWRTEILGAWLTIEADGSQRVRGKT